MGSAAAVHVFGADAAPRPNIIVILSDDMGFSDLGCYGGEIETPHLDALAAGGVRFTQFYNTARCCPTRASLLTGLYPHQAGVGHMMHDRGHDGYRGDLNPNCVTIAEVLKDAGYGTYMCGKWHVTRHNTVDGPKHNWPRQRGFDRFYGTIHGAGSFFDPNTLTRDNEFLSAFADPEYRPDTFYYTHAISHHAARFIADHHQQRSGDPFFLYVAYTAAHWPMHALPEDMAKYRGRYDDGYRPIREARNRRVRELGLVREEWELSPQAEEWDEQQHQPWDARNMEVYAAMIDAMDQGIGRIVAALKETRQFDNTLVLYLQDNGGCAEGMGRTVNDNRPHGPRLDHPTLAVLPDEFIQPDALPRQTRDGFPVRQGPDVMAGPADTYIGYGRGWANVSNTPFREYKHWVHEGGISTPLIAHWPAHIDRAGEIVDEPGHLIDIMATCVDVAGAAYPTQHNGHAVPPREGLSLVPAFRGESLPREAIYWEHESNRAIRVGNWKLVAKGKEGAWELYDLANDRTELHDLANEQPERVRDLAARWQAYAERAHVLPLF
ncbi:MAG: arylsulfatase [Planctomycetaceae bacterium]|nr:arylsulfatase [Planctomycetaceae bacterium]